MPVSENKQIDQKRSCPVDMQPLSVPSIPGKERSRAKSRLCVECRIRQVQMKAAKPRGGL